MSKPGKSKSAAKSKPTPPALSKANAKRTHAARAEKIGQSLMGKMTAAY